MADIAQPASAPVAELVFVSFNRRVAALYRENGETIWNWRAPRGGGPVAVMLDGDRLITSVQGDTYGLDAASGRHLWTNDLKGFGADIASLTSYRSSSMAPSILAQHSQAQASANPVVDN